jgi:hypothetical protein
MNAGVQKPPMNTGPAVYRSGHGARPASRCAPGRAPPAPRVVRIVLRRVPRGAVTSVRGWSRLFRCKKGGLFPFSSGARRSPTSGAHRSSLIDKRYPPLAEITHACLYIHSMYYIQRPTSFATAAHRLSVVRFRNHLWLSADRCRKQLFSLHSFLQPCRRRGAS